MIQHRHSKVCLGRNLVMRTLLQNIGKVQTQEEDESQPGAKEGEHISRTSLLTDLIP